jgi:S1-C subfamily serine protease
MGAPGEAGVVVLNVGAGGKAAKAGFAEGDLILTFGGQHVDTVQDLLSYTARLRDGQSTQVTVLRNYETIAVRLVK